MHTADQSVQIAALLLIGYLGQLIRMLVERHHLSLADQIMKIVLTIYWVVFGVLLTVSYLQMPLQGALMDAVKSIGLALGIMLSGVGSTLKRHAIQNVGRVLLFIAISVIGADYVRANMPVIGVIVLVLATGTLISIVPGPFVPFAGVIIGAIIIVVGVMTYLGIFGQSADVSMAKDFLSISLILIGLLCLTAGTRSLFFRQGSIPAQPTDSSA
jgi:hypothetical protein